MQHQSESTPTVSKKAVERGVSIAKQGIYLRWEWGDLALEVVPLSEDYHNGRDAALDGLLDRVAESGEITRSDLPSADLLRQYRDGAAVIPPGEYRKGVTIYFARELGQLEKDPAKRLAVIDTLRAEHPRNKATIDALRVMYDRQPTRTAGKPDERMDSEINTLSANEQAALAARLLADEKVRKALPALSNDQQDNILDGVNGLYDDEDRRNDEREAIRHEEPIDVRAWRLFKNDVQPNWLAAGKRLGYFEWTDERVRWMQEKGDSLRDEFHQVAAKRAKLSDDDFDALLGGDE